MAKNSIYFTFVAPPLTGGDFISVDHIVGLNRLGFDAKALYCSPDDGHTRFSVPIVRTGICLQAHDIVVMGEGINGLLEKLRDLPCIKVLHHQNPYYTFFGFKSVEKLNDYPFARVIVLSEFSIRALTEMGVTQPINRVYPHLASYFMPGPKRLQIAFSLRKRALETTFLAGYFRAKVPEYAHVPWITLGEVSREDCAKIMAQSAVYAAFAQFESLGLMNLEAMASGCHVVGYTGIGGEEYATPDNGDWIAEGDHKAFVAKLRDACRLYESGQPNSKIAAGHATSARFSRENFEIEMRNAWLSIMGEKADLYRK